MATVLEEVDVQVGDEILTIQVPKGTSEDQIRQFIQGDAPARVAEQLGATPASPPVPKPTTSEFDLPPLFGREGEDGSTFPGFSLAEKARLAAAFMANHTELGMAESLKALRPDTQIIADTENNVIVEFGPSVPELEGKRFFVNPPGMDKTDAARALADIAAFFPGAKFGARAATPTGRFLKTGAAEGATSIALDVSAQALGSGQPIDPVRAAIAALTGGTVEVAARPLMSTLRGIINKPIFFDASTGQLTERGRAAVQAAGLNPDDFGPALSNTFSELVAKGIDPFQAGSRALGSSFGVSTTLGQKTGNVRQFEQEEAIRQGVGGEDAQKVLLEQKRRQESEIVGARDRRRAGVIDTPIQVGGVISEGVQKAADTLERKIAQAYKEAGEVGAQFEGNNLRSLLKGIREALQDPNVKTLLDPNKPLKQSLTPGALSVMAEVRSLQKKVRSAARGREKGQMRAVDFSQFELHRRRMSAIINTIDRTKNPTDFATASIIKNQLDKFVDDAFDNALFSGDPDKLGLIKKARALRTEFGQKFEPRRGDREAGRIIQKILIDNPTTEQVANMVVGFGQIGGGAKLLAPKVIDRLNKILGPTSLEMDAVREAVLLKLIPDFKGTVTAGKVQSSINKALNGAPSLMKSLFSETALKEMRNFEALMKRLELPLEASNRSQSGFRLASLMGRVVGAKGGRLVGKTLIAAAAGAREGERLVERVFGPGRVAQQALRTPAPPATPLATSGAVGGALSQQEQLEQLLEGSGF